jgi:hypothetical protein
MGSLVRISPIFISNVDILSELSTARPEPRVSKSSQDCLPQSLAMPFITTWRGRDGTEDYVEDSTCEMTYHFLSSANGGWMLKNWNY